MRWLPFFFAGLLSFHHVVHAQDAKARYEDADVRYGLTIYSAQCAHCHGSNGDAVRDVDLRSGRFSRASSDAALRNLVSSGVRGTAMPSFPFNNAELTAIVAYLRNMTKLENLAVTGDAVRGRALVEGDGKCVQCHYVNGKGSRVAPDLSNIGGTRTAADLERSLVDPTGSMLPMNRSIRAVMLDGTVFSGRRLNEDTYSVQLIDSEARLRSLLKADIREYAVLTTSPMPSYRDKFDAQQIADIVSYLLSLRGIQ